MGHGAGVEIKAEPTLICFEGPGLDELDEDQDAIAEEAKGPEIQKNVKIIAIACGSAHCMALSAAKKVYSWGNGQGGRLGHGD